MQLGEIAQIKTGLVLRRKKAKADFDIEAKYRLISLNNIEEEGLFNEEAFETFNSNSPLDERYFTKEGDILVRFTHPYTAIYISKKFEGLLIPSSFGIIKVVHSAFMAEFVAWYLNSNIVKQELERAQTGSLIASTNKSILKKLKIKELPLVKQRKITNILHLYQKEKQLYMQLMQEKSKLVHATIKNLLQTEEEQR